MEHDPNQVNESLVNLTTAQKVTNDHLDSIDETLDALDRVIRGDYEKDQDGLVARFKKVETYVNELRAVVLEDSTGKKGLVTTVEGLVTGKMEKVERRQNKISLIIAIITSLTLVVTNIDKIGSFWNMLFGKNKPEVSKRHHGKPRKNVPEEDSGEESP